jgi:hypothetical protein
MTTESRRRSWLMGLLRLSIGPILLTCLAGGVLMFVSTLPNGPERKKFLWDAGSTTLVVGVALFVVLLWGGVYLQVVEASRGLPGLRSIGEPAMKDEWAAKLRALQVALSGLGFRHDEWFSLDDFDETHVSAWRHEGRSAAAFVLYLPMAGTFLLRYVSRFPDGAVLVSSTRLTDLSCPPPPRTYVQVIKPATVEELWAWHLEGERLFPVSEPTTPDVSPKELYVEVSTRWGRDRRSDPTWLLAVEPFEECWRMYRLSGMPIHKQIEQGWAAL